MLYPWDHFDYFVVVGGWDAGSFAKLVFDIHENKFAVATLSDHMACIC
jgi:hypothetical protein